VRCRGTRETVEDAWGLLAGTICPRSCVARTPRRPTSPRRGQGGPMSPSRWRRGPEREARGRTAVRALGGSRRPVAAGLALGLTRRGNAGRPRRRGAARATGASSSRSRPGARQAAPRRARTFSDAPLTVDAG
jgi:hypothetical protein